MSQLRIVFSGLAQSWTKPTTVPNPPEMSRTDLIRSTMSPAAELIWASPRELLNVFHAEAVGCDIITMTNDLLAKLTNAGKDLGQFSLETVKMFRDDAVKAGYTL